MQDNYLARQISDRLVGPIRAFREYIFSDVLPAFGNIDQRAGKVADDYYNRVGSMPMGEYEIDMSDVSDAAQEASSDWYDMMTSLRQSMINLLAAGLFHLVEQQLAALSRDCSFRNGPVKDTKWEVVAAWYLGELGLDIKTLTSWAKMDELRLVANSVKHGEGKSAVDLRNLRPELFSNPAYAEIYKEYEGFDTTANVLAAPLSGEDFFVTEELLRAYAEGAESFFGEIAQRFKLAQ